MSTPTEGDELPQLQVPQEVTEAADALRQALELESDRGLVLVAAAVLDDELGRLLEQVLRPKTHRDLLQGPLAPVGSFAARSRLAYGLSLISSQAFDLLSDIRRMRNKAAHSRAEFDLGVEPWLNAVQSMHAPLLPIDAGPGEYDASLAGRERFMHVVLAAYHNLHWTRSQVDGRCCWPSSYEHSLLTRSENAEIEETVGRMQRGEIPFPPTWFRRTGRDGGPLPYL